MSPNRLLTIVTAAAVSIAFAACSLPPLHGEAPPEEVVEPAVEPQIVFAEPFATHRFEIAPDDDVIGQVQVVVIGTHDTLSDVARRFNVGFDEIVRANPGVDPWLPGVGREVVVPTQFVLPAAERKGIVVNLPAMRVFYFPTPEQGGPQVVYTHPIGIGKVGWSTPEGNTTVVSKQENPTWTVPASIREEHRKMGDPLPAVVPPGPDNPLGNHKITLGWPSYLIHGTNKPYGVGMRTSHGCIRMYPEDVEALFAMVGRGTPVTVVNQPYVFGWHEGELFLQAYDVLEDDKRDWSKSRPKLLEKTLGKRIQQQLADSGGHIDWERVDELARAPRGMVVSVSDRQHGVEDLVATAVRVQNRVPQGANWDGSGDPAREAEQRDAEAALQARQDAEAPEAVPTVSQQRQVPRT